MACRPALAALVLSFACCLVVAVHGPGHAEPGNVGEIEKPEGSHSLGGHREDQAKSTGTNGSPVMTVVTYGCEDTYAWLECAAGKAISVIKATYGRTSTSVCKHKSGLKTDCMQSADLMSLTTHKVQELCNDRKTCSVFAYNTMFGGDPCPGTYKYVTVQYQCIDPVCKNKFNDTQCDNWAHGVWAKIHGSECMNNPIWMFSNCWKSCTNCNADCNNIAIDDAQCDRFALRGECERNFLWMYGHCQRSCKACPPDNKCRDIHDEANCRKFATNGDCALNPGWMYRHCRKSCGGCVRGCCNIFEADKTCEDYAKAGECEKNAQWMLTLCTQSCGKCPDFQVGAGDKSNTSDCEQWRRLGKCSQNPMEMLAKCEKTCLWFTGDECLNSYRLDWKCDTWADQGECMANPGWMIPNCRRSCAKCNEN